MAFKSYFTVLIILFLLASQVQANFAVDMIQSKTNTLQDPSTMTMDHCKTMTTSNTDMIDCHSQMATQECEDNCDSDHCVSSCAIISRYLSTFDVPLTQVLMSHDNNQRMSRLETLQRPPKLV
jgi:hypothetical protein